MISCENYDYIEIVCTYKYPIKLVMKSGSVIKGVATDTCIDDNRAECIKLEMQGFERLVVLDNVESIEICVDNPHFKSISFN